MLSNNNIAHLLLPTSHLPPRLRNQSFPASFSLIFLYSFGEQATRFFHFPFARYSILDSSASGYACKLIIFRIVVNYKPAVLFRIVIDPIDLSPIKDILLERKEDVFPACPLPRFKREQLSPLFHLTSQLIAIVPSLFSLLSFLSCFITIPLPFFFFLLFFYNRDRMKEQDR